jgi:hypothetical protein
VIQDSFNDGQTNANLCQACGDRVPQIMKHPMVKWLAIVNFGNGRVEPRLSS